MLTQDTPAICPVAWRPAEPTYGFVASVVATEHLNTLHQAISSMVWLKDPRYEQLIY